MNSARLVPFLACAFPLCGTAAAAPPVLPVAVSEFIGGTAESAVRLVSEDLTRSGIFEIRPEGQWTVEGSSSAGRIDGVVRNDKGEIIFNSHYDYPDLRDNAHAFADDVVQLISGVPGIASSKIAFISNQTGGSEIYIADTDGARVQRVTGDGGLKGAPSLGPGSLIVAYTSYASGFPDIRTTDLRDAETRTIIDAPGTNSGAAFSPDGTRLAVSMSHEGDPEIYITTPTGSRGRRVTNSESVEFSPAWAPEGDRLVFCSDATGLPQLYVSAREPGTEPQRLDTGFRYCTAPDWCPDGARIAFTARVGSDTSVVIYDLSTGQSRTALAGASEPTWAPDGRHLACLAGNSLIVLDTASGDKRTIVTGMGIITEPSWSR